ncbi:hypothetical protein CMUS01_10015 [Colletotrichum musicola]|uniref:Uncharacterized protein n=1 Tax=Colletotrichum musicola TaxID=2175873 RepID=A0A8H6K5V9_9PEZI|nr:hypothetical protein CMUS01_10015 [Colletotrichum musicola]
MPTPVASNSKPPAHQKPPGEAILCAIHPMLVKPGILSHDDPGHNTLKTFIDLLDTTATEKEQRLKASRFRAFADQADLARLYDAVFRSDRQPEFVKAANLQIYIWFPQHGPQPSKKPNFHHLIDIRSFTLYGWCGCLPRDDPKTSRTLILTTDRMLEDCPHWSKYPATPVQPRPGSHATAPQGPHPTRIGVINGHFPHGVLYPPPPEDEKSKIVPHHIYGGIQFTHRPGLALPPADIFSDNQPVWPKAPLVPERFT